MLQNYTPQETGIFVIVSRKIANNKWVKRQLMTFYHVREARPSRLGNRIFSEITWLSTEMVVYEASFGIFCDSIEVFRGSS